MGRSRLTLKRIASDTCRKSTFKQRRDVLTNKVQELSNLCNVEEGENVEACLIIYDTNDGDPQLVTWPENLNTEHSLIQRFESGNNEEPPITFGIQDYFKNKKEKVEADISKVRKEIVKIQYPTNHPCFNNLGDGEIRNFMAIVDAKSKACNERINMLKSVQTRSVALNSSQVDFTENSFQTEHTSTHMLHSDPNPIQLMTNNSEVINSTNQFGLPLDCATQNNPDVELGPLIDRLMNGAFEVDFKNL